MTMLYLTLLVATLSITYADIKPYYDQKNMKIKCIVNYLFKNFDVTTYKPHVIFFGTKLENSSVYENTFIDIAVTQAVKYKIPFIITDEINRVTVNNKIDKGSLFSLTYSDNCENMSKNIGFLFTGMTKIVKHFVIINEFCKDTIHEKIIEFKAYNIHFFIPDQEIGRYISVTVTPDINEKSCLPEGHMKMERLQFCYNETRQANKIHQKLFSLPLDVPLNYKKCDFNVGMASLYPYSTIKNKENLKTFDPLRLEDLSGSDIEIIKIIANYFNANLNLHYVYRNEENPYFDFDYLNFVINGSLDACVGGLYKIYGDIVSYSGIYSTQAIVWVYSVERSTKSWQTLIGKTHGLYIFLIFYILHSIVWWIVCKFDDETVSVKDTLLYSWGALVGATSILDARTGKQRILNILYLIMGIYLSSYVSCQIYSYLTIEEPPSHYRTIEELNASDKTPYLVPVSKYFVKDMKYESMANTSLDCFNFEDCERKLIENKASTVLIDGHLPALQARTAVNDEARVLRVTNEILTIYHEMIIRKDSPFVKSYVKVTQRLYESGICGKLYDEAIGILMVDKAKIANKNILSNSYSCTVGCKITLFQLAGIFYIWLFGCLLSCVVFIIEVLNSRETLQN